MMSSKAGEQSSKDQGSFCFKLSPYGQGKDSKLYFERIDTINLIAGVLNYALVLVIAAFMIFTLFRKNKLSTFTWKGLFTLFFLPLISGTS